MNPTKPTSGEQEPEQKGPHNPYAVTRPEFEMRRGPAVSMGFEIVRDGERVLAHVLPTIGDPHRTECDARMLAFAGKLHWALGNACSGLLSIAQDLRVIAEMAHTDPARAQASVLRVAATAVAMSEREHQAYAGALLTGVTAQLFDGWYNQPQSSLPSEEEVAEALAEFAETGPKASSGNNAPLPQVPASDTKARS